MRKQYIQPSMKAYKANTKAIICTSLTNISFSGGNGNGGPTTAEAKDFIGNDFWDEEWFSDHQ